MSSMRLEASSPVASTSDILQVNTTNATAHRIQVLETQLAKSRVQKAEIERELLFTRQHGQELAFKLGFDSVEEADDVIGKDMEMWERGRVEFCAKRVSALEKHLLDARRELKGKAKLQEDNEQVLRDEVERLKAENEKLKLEATSLVSSYSLELVTAELHDLQNRYDRLCKREVRGRQSAIEHRNRFMVAKTLFDKLMAGVATEQATPNFLQTLNHAMRKTEREAEQASSDAGENVSQSQPRAQSLVTNILNQDRTTASVPPSPCRHVAELAVSNHPKSQPSTTSTPTKRKRVDSIRPTRISTDLPATSALPPFPTISPLGSSSSARSTPRKRRRIEQLSPSSEWTLMNRNAQNTREMLPPAEMEESQTQTDSQAPTIFNLSPNPKRSHAHLASPAHSPSRQRRFALSPSSHRVVLRLDQSPSRLPRSPSKLWSPRSSRRRRSMSQGAPSLPGTPRKIPALLMELGLESPRVKSEDVEEWGNDSTRVATTDSESPTNKAGSTKKPRVKPDALWSPTSEPSTSSRKKQNRGKVVPETINARFEINPAANGGLDHQYVEVVRGKHARRKMCAVDCEECEAYYKKVGPMPPRLQTPAWRSPTHKPRQNRQHAQVHSHSPTSPSLSKRVTRSSAAADLSMLSFSQDENPREREMEAHKQDISRHRQTWGRGKTPPDFWNIGFPNTQEVNEINEKAREIHEGKEKEVEREARREGGKWRKRKGGET